MIIKCKMTYSDPGVQGFAVFVQEGLLDVPEVDLGAADDDPDEGLVVGAQTLHGVVEALGEEAHFALHAFY